jgi:DNA-binding transcriptional LysR family regulator
MNVENVESISASFRLVIQKRLCHDSEVELKQLKHFVAIAEEGGISAAARRLGLTQPALSRQVKALEEDLGVVLLDRAARSFALTPAAVALVTDAKKLLDYCDAMKLRVRAVADGLPLRIGYSPSLAADFLPIAIARFTQLHPAVKVTLQDISTLEMQRGVLAGKLDLMVTVPCAAGEAFEWTLLRECGWCVALSPDHRLAALERISDSDLNGERLLLYDREEYPDYWMRMIGYFKARSIQAKIAGEFDGISSLTAAIEANMGCAIIAETSRMVREEDGRVLTRRLTPQPEPLRIAAGVAARAPTPDHVLAFIEEMKLLGDVSAS